MYRGYFAGDTNFDSFNTYDEVLDEEGNVLIRRPNIVNIYDSNVKLVRGN